MIDPRRKTASRDNAPPNLGKAVALSVLAACFNEEENIDELIARTLRTFDRLDVSAELLLVDDGSADQTWSRIRDGCRRDPRVRAVQHTSNRGIEAAWHSGLNECRGKAVCLIDADLQNRPEDIARMHAAYVRASSDFVQGVRCPVRAPRMRYALSRGLNFILNMTFAMHLRDNKSGFMIGSRDGFRKILHHRLRYRYYQCFLAISAHAHGLSIRQINTTFEPRTYGKSFLNNMPLRTIGLVLWEIVKARAEFGRGARRGSSRGRPRRTKADTHVERVKTC